MLYFVEFDDLVDLIKMNWGITDYLHDCFDYDIVNLAYWDEGFLNALLQLFEQTGSDIDMVARIIKIRCEQRASQSTTPVSEDVRYMKQGDVEEACDDIENFLYATERIREHFDIDRIDDLVPVKLLPSKYLFVYQ